MKLEKPQKPRPHLVAAAFLLGSLAGCTGTIDGGAPGGSGIAGGAFVGNGGMVGLGGPTGGSAPGAPGAPGARDPGTVTLHRLNRVEYNNTIRDLFFGLALSPADDFPADDESHGFNNIASALSVDSVLFEMYERAADDVLRAAFAAPDRTAWLPCTTSDAACSQRVIESIASRAWRRPLEEAERKRLLAVVQASETAGLEREESLKQGVKAVLISPNFLFRVELDPAPSSIEPHALNAFELASRLSYFLWSSMPDEALFTLARSGELLKPAVVTEQVDRMMGDPKADALAKNFASQWLRTRRIDDSLTKDAKVYPGFNADLRKSMRTELDLLLARFIAEKRSLSDLLLAEDTFVDDRLAKFYGIPSPGAEGFKLVSLAGVPRRGILTTAGMQSLLAYPERTSPVVRGVWVLEQLLCIQPAPPPPNLAIPEIVPSAASTTREELAQHRASPVCASCHSLMDPLGLAFENYDAIGAYRKLDAGKDIDATGQLPDGQMFADALGMTSLLAHHPDVQRCLTEKAITYALGRGLSASDDVYVEGMSTKAAAGAMSFRDLAKSIATSDVFTMRRGEGP